MYFKSGSAAIFLLIVCMAGRSYAQTNQQRCSDVIAKMNDLKTAIEGICTPSTPSPTPVPNFYSPFNWTSVPKTSIGNTNLQHASTITFTIPSVIPSSAREVLIYVRARTWWSSTNTFNELKIFIQIGSNRYDKYIAIQSETQRALNTNSDNMWFPMPPNRRVYLTVTTAHGYNCGASLFAIGYR